MLMVEWLFQGEWGVTGDEEEEEEQRKQEFINAFIPTTRSQLRLLAESYQVRMHLDLSAWMPSDEGCEPVTHIASQD